jgi:hypothetical protein
LTQPAANSPDIIEIQPCTEEGLVTLEAKLGGNDEREILDPVILCRCLDASPAFDRPRCSAEMGYGMLEKDGRKIHAFKTGKVIIRRAEGREQALAHLRLVSRTIWPAVRVDGGEALVLCLASEKGCASFPAPLADGGNLLADRPFPAAMNEARRLPQWVWVEEGLALLRSLAGAYPHSAVSKATREQFRKAEGPLLGFIAESEDAKLAAVGLPLLAASLFLDRAMRECEKLAPEAKRAVWALTVEAFEAAVTASVDRAAGLKEKLESGWASSGANLAPMFSILNLASSKLP